MELPEGDYPVSAINLQLEPSHYYIFTSRTHPNDKRQGPRGTLHMALFWLPVYIYIRRERKMQLRTDSTNAKVVVGQYYLPDVFSPLVLLARTIPYNRQTDRYYLPTYLPTYYPLNKTLFCGCEMIHLQRGILRSSFPCTLESLMDDGDTCRSFSYLVGWKGAGKRNS